MTAAPTAMSLWLGSGGSRVRSPRLLHCKDLDQGARSLPPRRTDPLIRNLHAGPHASFRRIGTGAGRGNTRLIAHETRLTAGAVRSN